MRILNRFNRGSRPMRSPLAVALLLLTSTCAAAQSLPPSVANDPLLRLMKQFTEAPGPPGAEGAVRKLFTDSMKPYADKISYDGLGSVIAQQRSSGPRVMVDAHKGEIGALVSQNRPIGHITVQMRAYRLAHVP